MWTNIEVMFFIAYLLTILSIWLIEDRDQTISDKLLLIAMMTLIVTIIRMITIL